MDFEGSFRAREELLGLLGDHMCETAWAVGGTTALYLLHRDPEAFLPPSFFAGDFVCDSAHALDDAVGFLDGEYVYVDETGFDCDSHLIGVEIDDEFVVCQTVRPPAEATRRGRDYDLFRLDPLVTWYRQQLLERALSWRVLAPTLDRDDHLPVLTPGGVALSAMASMVVPGAFDDLDNDIHFAPVLLAAAANPMEFTATVGDALELVTTDDELLHSPLAYVLADVFDHLTTHESELQSPFGQQVARATVVGATRKFLATVGRPDRDLGLGFDL